MAGGGLCATQGDIRHNLITSNIVKDKVCPPPWPPCDDATGGGGLARCDGLIEFNTITENKSAHGSGLWDCDGLIRDNIISGNWGNWQPPMFYSGGGLWRCYGRIENNVIADNGTGLIGCNGTIKNNTIRDNTTGGLVFCDGTIEFNTISKNNSPIDIDFETETGGAGLFWCKGLIQNNIIIQNGPSPFGGGLFQCDPAVIRSNLIAGNSADRGGGLADCHGTIENNTIVGNLATIEGGGLYGCGRGGGIANCIIWGNGAPVGPQLDIWLWSTPTYSCIQGWTGGVEGNISSDPGFVDADGPDDDPNTYEDNNYRLLFSPRGASPCIDTGDNQLWMTYSTDLDGNRRVFCGNPPCASGIPRVDMGAYEYGSFKFSFMFMQMATAQGDLLQLTWNSRAGDSYTVWSSHSFVPGPTLTWIQEATVPSDGETTTWTDPNTESDCKFYRIEIAN
jgi:hypothetical protein